MEMPLSDFSLRDLCRELCGRALSTEGTKQQLKQRLIRARHEKAEAQAQGFARPGKAPIVKFGACVQPDDFAEIESMTEVEYAAYTKRVQWRLRRVHKTYGMNGDGLEYYHPGVLHRIDRSKTYALHMGEFWVRQEPYMHKIFAIFVMRTNAEDHRLCYARSLAKLPDTDSKLEPLMEAEEIARVLTNILLEIEHNGLENYVAIITEKHKDSMKALKEVQLVSGQTLPEIVLDACNLCKSFESMFSAKCACCLIKVEHELFVKATFKEQLERIQSKYTQNVEAEMLLKQYLTALPKVLIAMWKIEEHSEKPISLAQLNNNRLNAYSLQVQNDLPPITFEECAGGVGLLQLILFDTLWCLCDGHELEEENSNPTLDASLPAEWLPLLS